MEMIIELLNRRFDAVDVRLDDLTDQVRVTNGRVRASEGHIQNLQPRVGGLEREMGSVRKSMVETGENRRIRAWDVGLVVTGVGVALAFLKLIGKL